jgi:hypothetical protein
VFIYNLADLWQSALYYKCTAKCFGYNSGNGKKEVSKTFFVGVSFIWVTHLCFYLRPLFKRLCIEDTKK